MKSLLMFLACLMTVRAYAQQEVKKSGTTGNENPQSASMQYGSGGSNRIVKTYICPETGVKVVLSAEPQSARRYLSVTYIGKQFYGTAATVQAEFNALSGLPQNVGDITTNAYYGGTNNQVTVERITYDPNKNYCGYQGYSLSWAIGNDPHSGNSPVPLYKVTVMEANQYNSGTVSFADGTNLDGATSIFLIKAYNNKRNLTAPQRFPETCRSGCYNSGTTAGDGNTTNHWWERKHDYMDASNTGHDWGWGEENGDGENDGGITGPVVSGNTFNPFLENISLDAGVISHSFGGNTGYVNPDLGGHVGVYVPVTRKTPVSFGWNTSIEYSASGKETFEILPEGFQVGEMPSLVKKSSEGSIRQSLIAFETGPQFNFMLGRKVAISAIIQGGIASFKQSGFSFTQELQEGDRRFPIKIFDQQELKSTHFFWTPRLRIFYTLTPKVGIWAEGNYRTGQIEVNQSRLNVGEALGKNGKYTFSQMQNAKMNTATKQQGLNGLGLGFGIAFSLSKK